MAKSSHTPKLASSKAGTASRNPNHSTRAQLQQNKRPSLIFTIGHSTRTIEAFSALLLLHKIKQLIDVRTIPRSRHNPQFNEDQLPQSLERVGIRYYHMADLGGLRRAHRDSINSGWRNASFRGYADYMQTPDFENALNKLIQLAKKRRTAIMCAEAVPWRCHRSLIGDALLVRGIQVEEIIGETHTRPHTLTPWARVNHEQITYPATAEKETAAAKQREGK